MPRRAVNRSTEPTPERRENEDSLLVLGPVALLVVLCGLFYYKWGSAAAAIAGVRATGGWSGTAAALTTGNALWASMFYFRRIWIALAFGLVIAATVRAFVSPRRVVALFGRAHSIRSQVVWGLSGAPLMLCSCCVTPVFQSVYETGVRLSSALTLMLASPGLNPAALLLTFLLFPAKIGWARLGGALAVAILLPPILERVSGLSHAAAPLVGDLLERNERPTMREAAWSFVQALGDVALRTIPFIVVGAVLSSLVMPWSLRLSTGGPVVVALVAALAVVVALPTFFELPLAIVLVSAGSPGAAAAMLVAGPIVNLPSLMILGRQTRPKVAAGLAAGVWLIAVVAGLSVS